ncbi:MAG: hypothetical protein ACOYOS_24345 [Syntrophales bacterium]
MAYAVTLMVTLVKRNMTDKMMNAKRKVAPKSQGISEEQNGYSGDTIPLNCIELPVISIMSPDYPPDHLKRAATDPQPSSNRIASHRFPTQKNAKYFLTSQNSPHILAPRKSNVLSNQTKPRKSSVLSKKYET